MLVPFLHRSLQPDSQPVGPVERFEGMTKDGWIAPTHYERQLFLRGTSSYDEVKFGRRRLTAVLAEDS